MFPKYSQKLSKIESVQSFILLINKVKGEHIETINIKKYLNKISEKKYKIILKIIK